MLETVLLSTILMADTVADRTQNLDEVLIVSATGRGHKRSEKGQPASIDEHLSKLSHVNQIRRGSYAWEPVVNNMQTERLSTTIDGMKIFYACTDKMDPVTSYVESGNLQSISLNSGLDGNPQATGNIGGSLDLRLRKEGFDNDPFRLTASAGHESNGRLQVYGTDAAVSGHRFYTNFGAFYRHADDYKTGGGELIRFSQFQKFNAFANIGLRLTEHDVAEGTFIFDRATNVGYPALNMDVEKAEAIITSLSYRHLFNHPTLQTWETKVYYNHITHVMDDTKRPDVEIHMDMPGKSWTAGLYSLLTASYGPHAVQANYDLYYNRLFADMTMYPGGAAPMYMVTWPDVGTLCTGVALTDDVALPHRQSLRLSAKLAWQQQRLNSDEGFHAQRVFFPAMTDVYHQTTGRLAANYQFKIQDSQISIGAGWGSRAPTVTEAYGYYLNNTFDQYDYIGNPHLKNESAAELNGSAHFSIPGSQFSVRIEGNAFFFSNYIIGQFETRLSPMTVGAEGVKVYANISHATVFNTSLTTSWQPREWLSWDATLTYAQGRDDEHDPLPLVSPFTWSTGLSFEQGRFQSKIEVKGHRRQTDAGTKYGETVTPSWVLCNVSAQYAFAHVTLRAGIENLLDRRYATYADWNGIPQKGRNIYANITFEI